jgi:hypothetical protein
MSEDATSLQVSVRVRPLNSRERERSEKVAWICEDGTTFSEIDLEGIGQVKDYKFNRVFPNSSTNLEVYQETASPIIQKAVKGLNGCVFAYGQTGSGKVGMTSLCTEPRSHAQDALH